eukprot:CAMPEP_0114389344 /NCGR_PEP_ID=MMETSP0102-20121206/8607_1 /TAXON_ID=38822 ORGANISM="Pteridomonas danica, Strain PT" /NCGR_SAMPLE_ID=MMETSP0102 /ASSEMBLY_ACC=CAM_ASM_000212 /LENGTH=170 /DNA_ID=CAMNT_0001547235 /DNA_START=244 /DNA_END=753 /DNA_ORIENTATION=+
MINLDIDVSTFIGSSELYDWGISFWYNVYENQIGSLSVLISIDGGSSFSTIWTNNERFKEEDDNDDLTNWFNGQIEIKLQKVDYIRFQGIVGRKSGDYIAIDDLSMNPILKMMDSNREDDERNEMASHHDAMMIESRDFGSNQGIIHDTTEQEGSSVATSITETRALYDW